MIVQPGLDVRQFLVRLVHEARHVLGEVRDLGRDRIRQQDTDPDEDREPGQVDEEDRQPAVQPAALEDLDQRVEDQRDHACDDQDQQHGAGGPRERPQAEQRDRQEDELDPPRHDDRRHGPGHRPQVVGVGVYDLVGPLIAPGLVRPN